MKIASAKRVGYCQA